MQDIRDCNVGNQRLQRPHIGVATRQMGIAVYSLRLDAKGNSVRGMAAFRQLSDELGLHAFERTNYGSQYLRASGN
jgi:glutaminase